MGKSTGQQRIAIKRVALAGTLAGICLLANGCSRQPAAAPPATVPQATTPAQASTFGSGEWLQQKSANERNVSVDGGASFAKVTYRPEVKEIDKADVDASLQGLSSDETGAVFENASAAIQALRAGDIMLVRNGFVAKILAAETNGTQTVLIVDQVTLAEVVQQGEIRLEPSISFHGATPTAREQTFPSAARWMDLLVPAANAQPPPTIQPLPGADNVYTGAKKQAIAAALSGWSIEKWSVVPQDNAAALSARFTKDTSGFKAAVAMDGTITNFQLLTDLTIPMPKDALSSAIRNMSGKMHFTWEIGKDTPGVWAAEDKLRLPAGITIPLGPILDGMPLTLDISSAFLIHPALTGGNEYSKGGFTITWVGSKSALAKTFNDQFDPSGTVGLTFQVTDDANVSPIGPNGMVIAFCAPRIELKFGLFGSYAGKLKLAATVIDAIVDKVEKTLLSASAYARLSTSPRITVSGALASNADLYAQVIHTEGVTHSSNMALGQCSKVQLTVTGQIGGDMQLFNLTDPAKKSVDTFSKTYTHWDPETAFCKSI